MLKASILLLPYTFMVFHVVTCVRIQSVTVQEKTSGICPAKAEETRANASQLIRTALENYLLVPECGPGNWVQVASVNLSDPQQSCPSPWVVETNPARSCGAASTPACASVFYDTLGLIYQRVCGMALGYGVSSPDGFLGSNSNGIDAAYLDGISITYGQPRKHIWSLGAGHGGNLRCPCDNVNRIQAPLPPSFVGDNYFCDTYPDNGALWDGEGCVTNCCTFNSPPWFSAALPSPTSDNIESRICHDQNADDERVLLNTLYLFIQ